MVGLCNNQSEQSPAPDFQFSANLLQSPELTALGSEILYGPAILCPLVAGEEQIRGALCAARATAGNSDALTQLQNQRSHLSLVSACHCPAVITSSRVAILAGTDVNLITPLHTAGLQTQPT